MKKILPLLVLTTGICMLSGCTANITANPYLLSKNLTNLRSTISQEELENLPSDSIQSSVFNDNMCDEYGYCRPYSRTYYNKPNYRTQTNDDSVVNLESLFSIADDVYTTNERYETIKSELEKSIESTQDLLSKIINNEVSLSNENKQSIKQYSSDIRKSTFALNKTNRMMSENINEINMLKEDILSNSRILSERYLDLLTCLDDRISNVESALSSLTMINGLITSDSTTTDENTILPNIDTTIENETATKQKTSLSDNIREFFTKNSVLNRNKNTQNNVNDNLTNDINTENITTENKTNTNNVIKSNTNDNLVENNVQNSTLEAITTDTDNTNIDSYKTDNIVNVDTYGPDFSNLDTYWMRPGYTTNDFLPGAPYGGYSGYGMGGTSNSNLINNPTSNMPGMTTKNKMDLRNELDDRNNNDNTTTEQTNTQNQDTTTNQTNNTDNVVNENIKKSLTKNIDTYNEQTISKTNVDSMKARTNNPTNNLTNSIVEDKTNTQTLNKTEVEKPNTVLTPSPKLNLKNLTD